MESVSNISSVCMCVGGLGGGMGWGGVVDGWGMFYGWSANNMHHEKKYHQMQVFFFLNCYSW